MRASGNSCSNPWHLDSKPRTMACKAVSRSVAVIGAGAAGLASARELLREGHKVTVFEQAPVVGGTWVYDPTVEDDPQGRRADRRRIHSSMYRNLRTNLPREIMSYTDFPFTPAAMACVAAGARSQEASAHLALSIPSQQHQQHPSNTQHLNPVGPCASQDPRRYPSHEEVLRYLHAYATYYSLLPHIQLNTKVLSATPVLQHTPQTSGQGLNGAGEAAGKVAGSQGSQPTVQWVLETAPADSESNAASNSVSESLPSSQTQGRTWQFDALVVANGHYTEPSLPDIPGADTCPVQQIHSHNYREAEPWTGKVVLVVGASNSGEDISRELSPVAHTVLLSARTWKYGEVSTAAEPYGEGRNIIRCPMPLEFTPDGYAVFPVVPEQPTQQQPSTDASQGPPTRRVKLDAVIYATGYQYTFPFLKDPVDQSQQQVSSVRVHCGGRYVAPLYQHVFPASLLAPWLAFIGLCWRVIPFPQCELQARWVARVLSGRASLPDPATMQQHVDEHFALLDQTGVHVRYAHMQHMAQFTYNAELSKLCGPDQSPLPDWREHMYQASGDLKRGQSASYRDAPWDTHQDILARMDADLAEQTKRIKQTLPVATPVHA